MEITGISGNSTIYQFGHHPYAPGGAVGIREVPFELFSVSRQLDMREKSIDFDSQPFPHQIPPKYSQTILLPITIKNVSDDASLHSSGYSTPIHIPENPVVEEPAQLPNRSKSANTVNVDMIVADDRKIYSADCLKKELISPSGIFSNYKRQKSSLLTNYNLLYCIHSSTR